MKERILTGWNFRRVIYLLMGSTIIVQSAIMHEWVGILIGGYFSSMGLFAFGCATGNCSTANDFEQPKQMTEEIEPVKFEEIK
jgi:hypothetical protein